MSANTSVNMTSKELSKGISKRMTQVVFTVLIMGGILFLAAGRLDWWMAWAYIAIVVVNIAVNTYVLLRKDPALIAERGQIKEDAKSWDKLLALVISLLGPVSIWLVCGLDIRNDWSAGFALPVQLVAMAFLVLGYALWDWAMYSNRFFSGLVRIQKERGHTVSTGGAYHLVRHPGYLGMVIFTLAIPIMLDSAWGLVPAGLTLAVLILRTSLEDRTLQAELDGYKDYARRVRYRLIPGVW